jgi:hypothetical protein
LGAILSGQLETHALQVFVNDSDSWHYQLYYAGQAIDEFNSSGSEEFDENGDLSDLEGMFGEGKLADLQQSIQESAHELEQRLRQLLPDDLQTIQDRWKTGRATPEEIQKYTQWISSEMPRLMGGFKDLLGGLTPNFPLPVRQPADECEMQSHVVHLKPLLQTGVPDDRVREVLATQAVFAEETLGEFLPLLGIASSYAHLSYRYLDEVREAELAADAIRVAQHLKFKKADDPRIVR